jgi:hypothetical protein
MPRPELASPGGFDAWLDQFRPFWGPKLDALATEIARGKRARRAAGGAGRTPTKA